MQGTTMVQSKTRFKDKALLQPEASIRFEQAGLEAMDLGKIGSATAKAQRQNARPRIHWSLPLVFGCLLLSCNQGSQGMSGSGLTQKGRDPAPMSNDNPKDEGRPTDMSEGVPG